MPWKLLLANAALAFALVALVNRLALSPWRRAAAKHWSIRARELYPALVGQFYNIWVVPLGVAAFFYWRDPDAPLVWFHAWLAALCGGVLGACFLSRTVRPELTWRELRNDLLVNWGFFALRAALYVVAIARLARRVDGAALGLAAGVVLYDLWAATGGFLRLFKRAGVYRPAPPRLQRLVEEVCAQLPIAPPKVWFADSSECSAYALITERGLLFTSRIVAELGDDELKSVIAHELAHLSEGRAATLTRFAGLLGVWPWLFLGPLVQRFGGLVVVYLVCWRYFLSYLLQDFSRRMEIRADRHAHALALGSGSDPAYARALLRLYEVNQSPAVLAGTGTTHPHLYDRLLAAGVKPDFPRPEPPEKMHPLAFYCYAGLVVLIISQFEMFAGIVRAITGE